MPTKGADHSTAGATIGAELKAQGYQGVLRYAAEGRSSVNISRTEVDDLRAHGIAVGIVCEHSATWMLDAPLTVATRFAAARNICRAAGLPDGVIYGAADFDATNGGPTFRGSQGDAQMRKILAGLTAAAISVGHDNIGFYGGYYGIDWLVTNAPWIKWFWQTEAWSRGLRHPRANVYQHAQSATVGGVSLDLDDLITANWGQRVKPVVPTPANPPDFGTPPSSAKGEFLAEVQVNCSTGEHRIKGLPNAVVLGGPDRWVSARWYFDAETGRHRIERRPFNDPPLGGS